MLKRGQITVFVIIGIIIVAIAIIAIYLMQQTNEARKQAELSEISRLPPELQQEKNDIENCLSEIVQDAAITLGINGGYINKKPVKTISYLGNAVAYIESISKEEMENELENYVLDEFGKCKDDSRVKDVGAEILDDAIIVKAEMPVTLEVGESSARISFFQAELDFRLGRMLDVIESIKLDRDCMSCLMDETEKNEMKATINILEDARIMTIEDVNYAIEFAVS